MAAVWTLPGGLVVTSNAPMRWDMTLFNGVCLVESWSLKGNYS